jgi:hypothetical protein
MIIVVPFGNNEDPTHNPAFYDPIYEYLTLVGFDLLD